MPLLFTQYSSGASQALPGGLGSGHDRYPSLWGASAAPEKPQVPQSLHAAGGDHNGWGEGSPMPIRPRCSGISKYGKKKRKNKAAQSSSLGRETVRRAANGGRSIRG